MTPCSYLLFTVSNSISSGGDKAPFLCSSIPAMHLVSSCLIGSDAQHAGFCSFPKALATDLRVGSNEGVVGHLLGSSTSQWVLTVFSGSNSKPA